jgi:hypothetical protein
MRHAKTPTKIICLRRNLRPIPNRLCAASGLAIVPHVQAQFRISGLCHNNGNSVTVTPHSCLYSSNTPNYLQRDVETSESKTQRDSDISHHPRMGWDASDTSHSLAGRRYIRSTPEASVCTEFHFSGEPSECAFLLGSVSQDSWGGRTLDSWCERVCGNTLRGELVLQVCDRAYLEPI